MSLEFSNTTTKKGIIQLLESELGFNDGDISGNATKLKKFTADINVAFDDFLTIAINSAGTWQFDDDNFITDFPVIKTNIVGTPTPQRDYTFTTDGSGNLILDVHKVLILQSATATYYQEIYPIDELETPYNDILAEDTNNTGGTPYRYGKLANGIFLDPKPNYNATNGLKVYINREASYFTATDTTKKPGVPGNLHKYFYLKPAADYARRNNLANVNRLEAEVVKMEGIPGRAGTIAQQFAFRARDERKKLTMSSIRFR
jgi:hypothetical protein